MQGPKWAKDILKKTVESLIVKALIALIMLVVVGALSYWSGLLAWFVGPPLVVPRDYAMYVAIAVIVATVAPVYITWRAYYPKFRSQNFFGYHRTLYQLECFPYESNGTHHNCTRYKLRMEWRLTANRSQSIGPYVIRSSEPRCDGGDGSVLPVKDSFWAALNRGKTNQRLNPPYTAPVRHGYYQIRIEPPPGGFRKGDTVTFEGEYRIIGQHARDTHELSRYISAQSTTDLTTRKMLERKGSCEMLYLLLNYADRYRIRIQFPNGFPIIAFDQDEMVAITVDSNVVKHYSKRVKPALSTDPQAIDVNYKLHMRGLHGLAVYWSLPERRLAPTSLTTQS